MFWIRGWVLVKSFKIELTVENAFRPSLSDVSSDGVPGATLEAEQLCTDIGTI